MKILIVINDYLNKSNGMCISTQRFVREFRKLGHEVRIITNNRYGQLDYPLETVKIPIFAGLIEKEGYTFAKVNRKVIRQAVAWADVVHLEDPFLVCRRAAIEAKKQKKAVTGTFHLYPENITCAIHLGWEHLLNYMVMKFFMKSVYNRCDYVQCPTEAVRERLAACGVRSKPVVISNGVDDFFLSQERQRAFDGQLRILSVGRYAVEKDQKTLIAAVARCRHREHMVLRISGKGPLEEKLKKQARQLGVSVEFGFLSQEDLREQMLDSDLYVHCASVEVEGMSCMEAFACGCVPLVSDARLSSTKSFALDPACLYRHGDETDLAEKIDYLYEHPGFLERLSRDYMEYAAEMSVSACGEKAAAMMEKAAAERRTR